MHPHKWAYMHYWRWLCQTGRGCARHDNGWSLICYFSHFSHFKWTFRRESTQWNILCFMGSSNVNLHAATTKLTPLMWDFHSSSYTHYLEINISLTDSRITFHQLPPSAARRLRARVCVFLDLFGAMLLCGWPPMASLLGQLWKQPSRQTGARRPESAVSKHQHGWVCNESEERRHSASSGLGRRITALPGCIGNHQISGDGK